MIVKFNDKKILTSVLQTPVKEASIKRFFWNLCNQILKNVENVVFNAKFTPLKDYIYHLFNKLKM